MPGSRTLRCIAVACGVVLGASAYGMSATPAFAKTTKPTVKVAKVAGVGSVLVDAKGFALYTFTNDGQAVPCTGTCATLWPPLVVKSGSVKSARGVSGLATAMGRQVTQHGLPLYRYAGDGTAGQVNGNGINSFGGTWRVATTS
jgi:predicted lipoprotein with Yx(FWY)xxD motif